MRWRGDEGVPLEPINLHASLTFSPHVLFSFEIRNSFMPIEPENEIFYSLVPSDGAIDFLINSY